MRHNATVTISEERRLVTVLFVDLVGFTTRAEQTDPEEVREVQRSYFSAVAAEVERYGGTVEKYIGDAVMAIYGAPKAHDDDAARALHAALAIRAAVAETGHDLEIRIGVNTGEVVGGAGSGPQEHEYTVTGDAVNVAARLQQAAEPGEIYVGSSTRRLAAEAFEFATLPLMELKGKAEPFEVWRLVGEAAEPTLARGGEAPLVGRTRELRLLLGALEEAAEGHGLLVGLSGEAGIGKSRLALEVRARAEADGFTTAWAAAPSYSTSFPYHLLGQLAIGIGVAEVSDGPDPGPDPDADPLWAAALADLAGAATEAQRVLLRDVTPARRQRLLVQAIGARITARAEERPQLLILDDLHWADASSLAVLDELVALVPDHPIAVLALYRPGWENPWAGRGYYQQVNLAALRDTDAEEMVRALSPTSPLSDSQTAALLTRSGGNPFFLEELLRSGAAGNGAAAGLPETVHELLLARIDALGPEVRAVLQTAAVAGISFSERLLHAVEPGADLEAALGALQRADLVVAAGGSGEDRSFAMRHPLVHEVAYRSLLIARRRELHRRIGAWLEEHVGDDALAEIAAHYRDGDELDRARELLPRAAERAARLNAQLEAVHAYVQAADLLTDDPARRALMLERASAHSFLAARLPGALELATEARDLYERAGDRLHALNCRRLLGRYSWLDGRGEDAVREIDAAVEGLEALDPSPELALAYSYQSQLAFLAPDYELGQQIARKAIGVAEAVGSVEALAHALNNLGMCRAGLGDPGGIDDVRRSLAIALEHNLVDDASRAYTNLSGQGAAIGFFPYAESEALYAEMLDFDLRAAPGGSYEQWHRAGQAELWISMGRWDDAERQLREMTTQLRSANRYIRLDVATFLGLLLAYRGRHEEAATLVRPYAEVAVQIGDLQAYGPVFVALAHASRGSGEAAAATAEIERGIQVRGATSEQNMSSWCLFEWTDVAGWLTRTGGGEVSAAAVTALAALRRMSDSLEADVARGGTESELRVRRALYRSASHQLRLLAGGPVDGEWADALRSAASDLRREHRIFDAARVELWLAEASGDDHGARSTALATFEQLRAGPYVERARQVAPAG